MQAIIEVSFDAIYLSLVIILGVILILKSKREKQYILFGAMAIILGIGDSFHLIPRAIALLTDGLEANIYYLGIGKLITSITMTFFYLILYKAYRARYDIREERVVEIALYTMAVIRILLTLLPQNQWTSLNPPLSFGILRNIPFAIIGLIIIILLYKASRKYEDAPFKNMWLSIVLSFGFYIPVVLFSNTYPIIGALMIPKTLAYVWTVLIAYNDLRKKEKIGGKKQ